MSKCVRDWHPLDRRVLSAGRWFSAVRGSRERGCDDPGAVARERLHARSEVARFRLRGRQHSAEAAVVAHAMHRPSVR